MNNIRPAGAVGNSSPCSSPPPRGSHNPRTAELVSPSLDPRRRTTDGVATASNRITFPCHDATMRVS